MINKRKISLFLAFSLIFISLSSFASCESKIEPKNKVLYDYFDTVSIIYDYNNSSDEDFREVSELFSERLSYYHKLFDIYNEYEGIINLATINRTAAEGAKKVAPEIIELLSFSVEMYNKTGGKVNVAMGSVLSLWHDARAAGVSIPTTEQLSEAAKYTSVSNIVIDKDNLTVEILDSRTSIDVGAVAKGYAAEKIAEELSSMGKSGYAINLGGNLRVVGSKPNGDGWVSGVKNYKGNAGYAHTITMTDSSLVTSGIYERFYTVGGKDYHHIIDPDTLMPENNYYSVSIHTYSSLVADALSTAFFNMTKEEIKTALKSFPNTEVIIINTDGKVEILGKY